MEHESAPTSAGEAFASGPAQAQTHRAGPVRLAGPVRWEHLTWPEFDRFDTAGDDDSGEVGLIPVGATEQHGPHLPTDTDTRIALGLCELVSARTGAVVLPPIAIGCSLGHGSAWPGGISLSPTQLADVCVAYAEWAAVSGVRRLLFVNAHFGNASAIRTAIDRVRFARTDVRLGLVNWWDCTPEILAEVCADGDDIHANRAETAVVMALSPEIVRTELRADADDADRTAGLVFTYTVPYTSTNGVTGRPSEATPELGARLVEAAVSEIAQRVERGRKERPPLVPAESGSRPARAPLPQLR